MHIFDRPAVLWRRDLEYAAGASYCKRTCPYFSLTWQMPVQLRLNRDT